MSRTMSLTSFGQINTIFSFIAVVSVIGNTFNLLTAKYIAEDPNNSRVASINSTMLVYAIYSSFVLIVITLIGNPWMSKLLNSENFKVNILTILVVCTGFLPSIFSGALAGLKKFVLVGILSMIMPIFKIAGSIGIISIENNESKVILILSTMIIGYLVAAFSGFFFIGKNKFGKIPNKKSNTFILKLGKFSSLAFASNFLFMLLSYFDMFSVNTLFGEAESGLYSSAMLFGKIIFYFVTAFVTVMLPFVASENVKKGSPITVLKKTLLFTILISIILVVPINVFPKVFLNFVYRENFINAAKYIPYSSIIAVLTSILYISINYLIGIGQIKSLFYSLLLGIAAGIVCIAIWHNNSGQVLMLISLDLAIINLYNIFSCFKMTPQGNN